MDLKKCDKGHIYNIEKDENCPYCILLKDDNDNYEVDLSIKTVAYIEENIEPIVAWLVNIYGAEKGKDYKLVNGRNFIGSGKDSDVIILGDEKIKEDNHFSISYNNKQKSFVISPGTTGEIIYINKKALYETKSIENFSLIEAADTKLVFVKFCGENFNWNSDG